MNKNNEPHLIKGGISVDDRGTLKYSNDFDFSSVKRFYIVENHSVGFIRAWHGHKNESKFALVLSGTALFGVVSLSSSNEEPKKFILDSNNSEILYIPSGFANGFMNLKEGTKVLFFSDKSISDSLDDDIRYEYDKWDIWDIPFR